MNSKTSSKSKQVKITSAYTSLREDRIEGTVDGQPFVIVAMPGTITTNEQVARIITSNYHALAATEITTISKNLRVDMEEQVLMPGCPPTWVFIRVTPA